MEYYLRTSNKDSLIHYGIKGMKWGVRRYQNSDGSLTAKGKERYRNTKSGMSKFAGMLDPNMSFPPGYKPDTFAEVVVRPNDKGGYDWKTTLHPAVRESRRNQAYLDDPDSAMEKHAAKINNNYGTQNGTTNNCTKVAANNCMAMMGWDYDAGRSATGNANAFDYWFDNAEKTVTDNLGDAIEQKLSKTANGSFGTVDLRRGDGKGGHVFNWQRKSTGEFSLIEGQGVGIDKFTGSTPQECFDGYLSKYSWFTPDATVRVYDMTNATPNFDHMQEDSVCRITDDPSYNSWIVDRNTNKLYRDL